MSELTNKLREIEKNSEIPWSPLGKEMLRIVCAIIDLQRDALAQVKNQVDLQNPDFGTRTPLQFAARLGLIDIKVDDTFARADKLEREALERLK